MRILAYVRPENISLTQAGVNGRSNVLDGVVERVVFDGSTIHVNVKTDVAPLLVEVGGSERLELMTAGGSSVRVAIEELTLIPDPAHV
jgi:hypothetical protein